MVHVFTFCSIVHAVAVHTLGPIVAAFPALVGDGLFDGVLGCEPGDLLALERESTEVS